MISVIFQQTVIITTFVLGMMMVIEYINVQTRGMWSDRIQSSPFLQIVLGSLMGIIPGCLGTYTVVSLYVHRVIMFPALVATFIATSGDEAFLMFTIIPVTALKLNIMLFAIAVITGIIVHFTVKNKFIGLIKEKGLPLHNKNEECNHYDPKHILTNLRNLSFTRALLLAGALGLLISLSTGIVDGSHHLNTLMHGSQNLTSVNGAEHAHDHHGEADWIRISLIVLLVSILYILLTVKDHFLQEHLWQHILKKHFLKIFLWTFGVILSIHLANQYINLQDWISANLYLVLLIAVLIGIIPESGPHYIFVLLFAQGAIPLSILLASSIVQDGHGSLPLLAESQKGFFAAKIINIIVGLLIGAAGLYFGY